MLPHSIRYDLDQILSGQRAKIKVDLELIHNADISAAVQKSHRANKRFAELVCCVKSMCDFVDELNEDVRMEKKDDKKLQALQTAYESLSQQVGQVKELAHLNEVSKRRNTRLRRLESEVAALKQQNQLLKNRLLTGGLLANVQDAKTT